MIPIKHSLCLGSPFVDYLNITAPKDLLGTILSGLKPFIDVLGMSEPSDGLYRLPEPLNGTFKVFTRGNVVVFGASGGFLSALRERSLYVHYLMGFAHHEHRISMMHVTQDYEVDAPKTLTKIYNKGVKGDLYLTRKSINPLHVTKLLGRNLAGFDTGTVYLGNRANSDVWAKVYDKQQERIAKGDLDAKPRLRVEIAVQSDVGATLRDASLPSELFYHFAGNSLVERPKGLNGWSAHGEGFTIEAPAFEPTAWERLSKIVDFSNDIGRLFDLALAEYGDDALPEIQKIIRNRFNRFQAGKVSREE